MRNTISIRVRVSFRVRSASPFRKIPVADFPHYTHGMPILITFFMFFFYDVDGCIKYFEAKVVFYEFLTTTS